MSSWARHRDGYELVSGGQRQHRAPPTSSKSCVYWLAGLAVGLLLASLAVRSSPQDARPTVVRPRAGFNPGGHHQLLPRLRALLRSRRRRSPRPVAPAASTNAPAATAATARSCPTGCSRHGNCNALTGECVCAPTHAGAACERPLLPACALGGADDETLNLSWLASSEFWQAMHWVTNNGQDKRRTSPPFRWVGVVPCDCVVQAVQLFSLRASPQPARWPKTIQPHEMLSMQRIVCAHTALSAGALWAAGGPMRWSHVPVVAWLKGGPPTHAPALLPHGIVSEAMYVKPPDWRRMHLNASAVDSHVGAARPLSEMLPGVAVRLSAATACPASCHGGGWCGAIETRATRAAARRRRRATALAAATPRRGTSRAAAGGRRTLAAAARGAARGADDRLGVTRWRRRLRLHADEEAAIRAADDWAGADVWRWLAPRALEEQKRCPNECWGRGRCLYGFCHCGRPSGASTAGCRPRAPRGSRRAARRCARASTCTSCRRLRRSCASWRLPEDLGDHVLASDHLEPDAARADLFWVYGCPNVETVLPALAWVKRAHPHWAAAVAEGRARHVLAVPHEEGWAEVWRYLALWVEDRSRPNVDHSNGDGSWDDLHPASATRQLATLQLSGDTDYVARGARDPLRRVSATAPCYICFQPGKDVVVPAFPGLVDYPNHRGFSGPGAQYQASSRGAPDECAALARHGAWHDGKPAKRSRRPRLFFSGAVITKGHGPELYEASRVPLYRCWKNASRDLGFQIVQTEHVDVSVYPWEVERGVDANAVSRQASVCVVPEGKSGGYGHRATTAAMLGCVPLFTKERFSFPVFHEEIDWKSLSLHVPPAELPRLPQLLEAADVEAKRARLGGVRRRLLWASIYSDCRLAPGGGAADAFDTLMATLRRPRVHFRRGAEHRAPRAPELLPRLDVDARAAGRRAMRVARAAAETTS